MIDAAAIARAGAPSPTTARKTRRVTFWVTDAQDTFVRERMAASHISASEYFRWLIDMDMERVRVEAAQHRRAAEIRKSMIPGPETRNRMAR